MGISQQQEQAAAESYAAIAAAMRAAEPGRDSGDQPKETVDNDDPPVALTAVFAAWRRGIKALAGDMAGLVAAEGKLAAVGAVQMLLGALIVLSLATLALLCLEIALALLLYSLALSPLIIALIFFAVNLVLAVIIVGLIKPLTANFSFEHSRQMLSKSDPTNAVATAPQQQPEPREQAAQPTAGRG